MPRGWNRTGRCRKVLGEALHDIWWMPLVVHACAPPRDGLSERTWRPMRGNREVSKIEVILLHVSEGKQGVDEEQENRMRPSSWVNILSGNWRQLRSLSAVVGASLALTTVDRTDMRRYNSYVLTVVLACSLYYKPRVSFACIANQGPSLHPEGRAQEH